MTWIRILSGSQKGSIVNLTETEAQANVDTGYAEFVEARETTAHESKEVEQELDQDDEPRERPAGRAGRGRRREEPE